MKFDHQIELGTCGMGMPVIRSWQALKDIPIDGILKTSSAHP
ncbi:hypothetical protein OAN76_00700 [Candidatus Marinimicrobia bacterium]|nr:hypothetical protein [Candidatus Neomarinimicrobiota bacterium]MDC1038112.1 hypothetical protein [Candidatus Neomarinimicrobiota bacterium]